MEMNEQLAKFVMGERRSHDDLFKESKNGKETYLLTSTLATIPFGVGHGLSRSGADSYSVFGGGFVSACLPT